MSAGTTARDSITRCVDRYYEALFTSNAAMIEEVFHENAMVAGHLPDGLHQMTRAEFAGFVAAQQPSPAEAGADRMLEILSCDIAGHTAAVRIREAYLGMIFVDTFGMLEVDGRWTIYNKLFHVEG